MVRRRHGAHRVSGPAGSLREPCLATGLVYLGNFAGAIATAWLVHDTGIYRNGSRAVDRQALDVAAAKASLGVEEAVTRGSSL